MSNTKYLTGIDPEVNYETVPSINHKRSLAFINHFIMRTVDFLNTFSRSCESKLIEFENKLQKIEASILILEAKLSSIPELQTKAPTTISAEISNVTNDLPNIPDQPSNNENEIITSENNSDTLVTDTETGVKAKDDVRYVKFFKMLQFGVSEAAVKLQMQVEGIDPNILNDPTKIVAN